MQTALAESEQRASDLVRENERQTAEVEEQQESIAALRADAAALRGKIDQIEVDLSGARDEAVRERTAAEHARTQLAKAQLHLETTPRLEAELTALPAAFDAERLARTAAE